MPVRGRPGGLFGFSAIDLLLKEEGRHGTEFRDVGRVRSPGSSPGSRPAGRAAASLAEACLCFAKPPSARRYGHKLSRRALLAGACAGAALPISRHSGLDPESTSLPAVEKGRWIPDQVRDDGKDRDGGKWLKALADYAQAEAGLEAVAHTEDHDLYGRALGRHSAALARLLGRRRPISGRWRGSSSLSSGTMCRSCRSARRAWRRSGGTCFGLRCNFRAIDRCG